jgi:GNAT superfamily N-acetyltransferase
MIVLGIPKESPLVKGMASFHYMAAVRSTFLGYLAVARDSRGKGFGTKLFQAVGRILRNDSLQLGKGRPLGIFCELDKEDERRPQTYERFHFWEKQDMLPLKLDWRYPPLYRGNVPALMYLAFCPMVQETQSLNNEQMVEVCRSIYATVYLRASNDQRLEEVIASFARRRFIERFRVLSTRSPA